MRPLLQPLLFALVMFALGSGLASGARVDIPSVTISGPGFEGEVRLAPADADALRRRLNQPPRLEEEPEVSEPSYTVTTAYWDAAVRREDEDEEEQDVDPGATYYPDGGFVRAELGGDEVWIVLDLRQRAILDRYIRQAREGVIGPEPGALALIANAFDREAISLEAAGELVDRETALEILNGLASQAPRFLDPQEPPAASSGYWLLFTFAEGRALQYYYDGGTLTDLLGTERYDASQVAVQLDTLAPGSNSLIQHDEPAGSLLWWPVMAGGGVAAIGAAVWLRRRGGRRV